MADLEHTFLLSGNGELIEPDDGVLAVGSGGDYALAPCGQLGVLRREGIAFRGAIHGRQQQVEQPIDRAGFGLRIHLVLALRTHQ